MRGRTGGNEGTSLKTGTISFTCYLTCSYITFYFPVHTKQLIPSSYLQNKQTFLTFLPISPPPGVSAAGRAPVGSTCSAGCSIGGWSGCAGSAVVTAPRRSRRRCAPSSTGSHTADSYNWSRLLLSHCCLVLLLGRKQSVGLGKEGQQNQTGSAARHTKRQNTSGNAVALLRRSAEFLYSSANRRKTYYTAISFCCPYLIVFCPISEASCQVSHHTLPWLVGLDGRSLRPLEAMMSLSAPSLLPPLSLSLSNPPG